MNYITKSLIWLNNRSRWHNPLAIPATVFIYLALTKNNIATIETSIFLVLLILVLWWRLDGRLPVAIALIGLVITAIINTYANHYVSPLAEMMAERVAVWVFFLLVIGVARLVWESRQEA
ncbi:MAG: hypothetical protein A3I08_02790 [Candidatus Andersenbacteria bacterium RIFCSPLOWO2_02_FULL_46_11]|nr:MAG: hypothetical protein A3B76_01135 [Candidatus Andersenbacteria bacterium RIFCSPHIGHO2_02_FULL_46_16]OGY38449.1 MAG: hypothetical protein A3I08_02790 [Candidatus Andersenbacteria bacterium RIFCSPLOWO2_02_FULL_46_11]